MDGEACFNLSIYTDSKMKTGMQTKPLCKITLHKKDMTLLELIKTSLGVGQIYKHGKDSIDLRISSMKDLRVIIDHLDKYPLITQKLADYILLKKAIEIIDQKEHLSKEGIQKLLSIKASLN